VRQLDRLLQVHDPTFGAPAHGARDMERRGFRRAAGKNEGFEWRELDVTIVDCLFQLCNTLIVDPSFRQLFLHACKIRCRQDRADGKQIALNRRNHFIDPRHHLGGTHHSETRIELVDVAVGFDTHIIFFHTAAAKQPGRPRISGLRINLERHPVNFADMDHEIKDVTILGAGPTGLFALFYSGMRGATAQVLDALPQAGGQLTALYPEKYIFDVAGFPKVLAKDLVKALETQAAQFNQPVHVNQHVIGLEEADGHLVIVTETDRFPTRSVVIAAGIGAFAPRRLPQACAEPWYGRGIYDRVIDPEQFRDRKILIIGGGDSAFDWAQQLNGRASTITLMHRSDRFRAHASTVDDVMRSVSEGGTHLYTFHELQDIHANGDAIERVTIRDVKAKTTREIEIDVILPMLGFVSDLGTLTQWGLQLDNDEIVVNSQMETGRPGVYAAGDICTYPGKLKLIATGFAEAATAVNQAVHWIYPEKKVNPGHSSNLAIFGQKDD